MFPDKSAKHYIQATASPKIISMMMTSRCNLKCVMCDHGIRDVEKEDFDADLLEKADDFISKATLVDLTGLGEPLISDLFWKILEKYPAQETEPDSQYFLTFNSNGTLLNDNNINRILAAKVKKIRVSIDSPDSSLYQKIRGTSLEKVVSGLRNLVDKRNSLNRSSPKIAVEMTLMRENLHSVNDMIDLCKDLGVDFLELWSLNEQPQNTLEQWTIRKENWEFDYSKQLLSTLPLSELKRIIEGFYDYANQRKMHISSWIQGEILESENFFNLTHWEPDKFEELQIPWKEDSIRCILPWVELRVGYQGDVHPCCWSPQPLGNLRNETIENIWNNEATHDVRSDLINGNIPRRCSGAACPHIQGARRIESLEWINEHSDIHNFLEIAATSIDYKDVTGFFPLEKYEERPLRWTNGSAEIPIEIKEGIPPKSLIVKVWNLRGSEEQPVVITANDVLVFSDRLTLDGLDIALQLPPLDNQKLLVIKVTSSSEVFPVSGDTRNLGIAIESLQLSNIEVTPISPVVHFWNGFLDRTQSAVRQTKFFVKRVAKKYF
jgi:MoaA/NifB/PqqE/SkfB family radical SAM enzyme